MATPAKLLSMTSYPPLKPLGFTLPHSYELWIGPLPPLLEIRQVSRASNLAALRRKVPTKKSKFMISCLRLKKFERMP
jgi:hypothetical protein